MIENVLIKKLGEICLNVILSVLKIDFSGVWIMTEKQKDVRLDIQTEPALKIIMDASSVGIVVFGSDLRIIYGNPTALKLFGKQATEIFGLRCGDFVDCSKRPDNTQMCGQTESCPQCSLFRAICAALSGDSIKAFQEGETLLERDSGLNAIWVKYKVSSIVMKGTKFAIMTVDDITDRKQAEKQLRKAKERFRSFFENAAVALAIVDPDGHVVEANKMHCRFLGYRRSELIGKHFAQFTHPDDLLLDVDLYKSLQEGHRQRYEMDKRYIRKDGEVFWGHLSVSLIPEKQGFSKYTMVVCEDITDRKCAEATIKEAHQRLLAVLDSMDAGIYVADMETYELLFVNRCTQNIYGNIVGKKCWQTLQEGMTGPCEFCTNDKLLDADGRPTGVYQWEIINTKTERWYECRDNALRWIDGRMVRLEIALDITDRKKAEEVIKTSLREKETLLKELHHRVKNNMQVISSLLNLQMMRNQDERVKKALMDCRGRINSMASIHEMLYASDSLSVIDCHKYFSKLTRDILHSYHPRLQRVKLTVDAKGVTLGIQQSLPLGLMINELLSNALKYGFPKNMYGHIMVRLKACEQDMLEFVFSDDGIGIPQNIDWRKTGSLGLNLIVLLAENQLGGTVSLDRAKGTRFTIKFRREEL